MGISPVKAVSPLLNTVFQENMASPQEVECREHNGAEKGVANTARAEAGEIDQTIREPIGGIEKVDKQRPSIKPHESVSDCEVEGR